MVEAEAVGSQMQSLSGLHSEFKVILCHLVRPCLKIKSEKKAEDSSVVECLLSMYPMTKPQFKPYEE